MLKRILGAGLLVLLGTAPAFAHLDPVAHGSFLAGFTHPLFGLDHILAMVAVGLWAASLGGRALWVVPAAFVGTMALGFLASLAGMPLPFVEPAILASVIFMGIVVALALSLPLGAGAALVAFFALFHGHAHGGEMGMAGAWSYALGFLAATALLHAGGIALGLAARHHATAIRVAGGLAALGGGWLALAG